MRRVCVALLAMALPLSVGSTLAPPGLSGEESPQTKTPRREVFLSCAPGASGLLTLRFPGRYVLASDLRGLVIEVASPGVTLDLAGHEITANEATAGAITVRPEGIGTVIRGGVISGSPGWGIDARAARGCRIEGITLRGNAAGGVRIGPGGLVRHCAVEGPGPAIAVTGVGAWIAENDLCESERGLEIVGTDNVVAANRSGRLSVGGGNWLAD
ncbi:MAG: hypothetical protein HUU25_01535 [Candidatus Sumerlaeia bacterium]|nr:hypothetical protein [Candidatus Sumerlaeia bacterium]